MNQHERDGEDRALEALIVSQLRRERECCDINDLPELTAEERAVMNAAPADLIEKLWEQAEAADLDADDEEEEDCEAEVEEDLYVGMNRANGPTDETHKKLDEARKEVLDELKKLKKKGNGGAKP